MAKWLDKIHSAQDVIRAISENLHTLSISFTRVGNCSIGNELSYYSDLLQKADGDVSVGVNTVLNEMVSANDATHVSLLKVVLMADGVKDEASDDKDRTD